VSVAIIDYGSGNLHSAAKAFERAAREEGLNEPIMVTSDPEEVRRADRVVLPGVGAFADCRRGLDAVGGMVEALNDSVRARARPFLGICVGMQLMAERGREYEVIPGLGWIPGEVDRIAAAASVIRRHRCRRGRAARLFRALLSSQGGRARRSHRRGGLWRARHRRRWP
jgi:glutamine amidotransferase